MITINNVSKVYPNGSQAVKNITLEIEKDEFVFIIGSSGSGKSTLIKMLMKELDPSSGEIIINGINTTKMSRSQIPYRPPVKTAKARERRHNFAPRKSPQPAISLISPPPKAPGTASVSSKSGTLTAKIPMILERIPVSGMVKTDRSPDAKAAATKESGISMVSQSTNPTTRRSPRKRITVTDAAGLSKYIWDATAAAPPKTMLIRYLGRNPPLRNAR